MLKLKKVDYEYKKKLIFGVSFFVFSLVNYLIYIEIVSVCVDFYIFFSVLIFNSVNFCFSVFVINVDNVKWLLCICGFIFFFSIGYVL